jgi:hypothetical protein
LDKGLWKKFLNAEVMEKSEISKLLDETPWGSYYDSNAEKFDLREQLSDFQGYMEKLKKSIRVIGEDEAVASEKEKEDEEEVDLIVDEGVKEFRKLVDQGVSEDFVKEFENKLISESKRKDKGLSLRLRTFVSGVMNNQKRKADINRTAKEVLKMAKDRKTYSSIFEVPSIFSTGHPRLSDVKNRSLRDPKMRAEREAFYPGVSNKILSGTLSITPQMEKRMKKQIMLCKRFMKDSKVDVGNKKFLIDNIVLMLNDAHVLEDSNDKDIWEHWIEVMDDKIVVEEEEEEWEDNTYRNPHGAGVLNYGLAE